MITEELEFAISQYVDGTLPASERAALELRLEGDPDARALLDEYRRLETSLKQDLPAVPEVDWDRLATHISTHVADEAGRPLTMPWVRRFAPLAVAASLIIGVGVAAVVFLTHRPPKAEVEVAIDHGSQTPTVVAVVEIEGPAAEIASEGQQVAQVEIGPSPQYAALDRPYRAADAVVVSRPSRVVWIATGAEPAQDGRQLPY